MSTYVHAFLLACACTCLWEHVPRPLLLPRGRLMGNQALIHHADGVVIEDGVVGNDGVDVVDA